jgi:predicted nucleic acid-binding protein
MKYTPSSSVVADANLAIRAVIPVGASIEFDQYGKWKQSQTQIFVPDLWCAEVTSSIRYLCYRKAITLEEGRTAIGDLFALGVQIVATDIHLCLSAFQWSQHLGQIRAYDSFYLALAEKMGIELWTADQRLANRARQVGAGWVRWIGEASTDQD